MKKVNKDPFSNGTEYSIWEERAMRRLAVMLLAALINRISGKGTWEFNPWVYVYEFELLK